ncbi:hypothetical protein E1176_13395 [Fulvivirga sp. RKSG066]|uniref:hypothetical protein n=1 Tax=Fulvivirga aurantia TaxID=2529383 RepID=UPI0012BBF34D|nr:hypothetical protein [Fulvivirga aurantia]MTI22020.1 hypothetical protein [Fulvivirga aurantia]
MATITMYLKHQNDDLYYSMDNVNFSPLEVDTVTGVDAGDEVFFRLAEDSNIEQIKKINVNESKAGEKQKNWQNIWETKPTAYNKTKDVFRGVIKADLDRVPKYNGYTIKYKTTEGDMEKDPEFEQPKDGGNM